MVYFSEYFGFTLSISFYHSATLVTGYFTYQKDEKTKLGKLPKSLVLLDVGEPQVEETFHVSLPTSRITALLFSRFMYHYKMGDHLDLGSSPSQPFKRFRKKIKKKNRKKCHSH